MSAYEIVMDSRRQLVEKMLESMQQGLQPTRELWQTPMAPFNPLSGAVYRGGNRLKLIITSKQHGYEDPRWMTVRQLNLAGYKVKAGVHGVLCEKWIFPTAEELERYAAELDEGKNPKQPHPKVSYFIVFNGEQVEGFPKWEVNQNEIDVPELADQMITISECPVYETAEGSAYYTPGKDEIHLPFRRLFKDGDSFCATLLHEMGHSTGHESRLGRKLKNSFGTIDYAREELRAELGSLFIESELGVKIEGEHWQDHSNYLASWIEVLQNDPSELYRAAADAEKIAGRIVGRYLEKYPEKGIEHLIEKEKQRFDAEKAAFIDGVGVSIDYNLLVSPEDLKRYQSLKRTNSKKAENAPAFDTQSEQLPFPEAKLYTYYATEGPLNLGTNPVNGELSVENYPDKRMVESIGKEAWGKVTYGRALTREELKQYGLVAEGDNLDISVEEERSGKNPTKAQQVTR